MAFLGKWSLSLCLLVALLSTACSSNSGADADGPANGLVLALYEGDRFHQGSVGAGSTPVIADDLPAGHYTLFVGVPSTPTSTPPDRSIYGALRNDPTCRTDLSIKAGETTRITLDITASPPSCILTLKGF